MATRTISVAELDAASQTPEALLTMASWPMRMVAFRIDLLSHNLSKIGEVQPIRPGLSVQNNINRSTKRTMEGLAIPKIDLSNINYFSERVRPMWLTSDGGEYPMGVFLISDASTVRHSWGRTAELTLADQGLVLSQLIDRSVSYSTGFPVAQAMDEVIQMIGLPAWEIDRTEARIGAPVTWAFGNDVWSKVLNDLADLAGFTSGYFDNRGIFQLRRAPQIGEETRPDFNYDSPQRIYEDSIVESDATIDSPNRYVVISTSSTEAPVVGVWDVPATAPHSFENRGFRVVSVTQRQGLSRAQAEEAARVRGIQDADTYQWASFSAAPDPRHDTFDLVQWQGVTWREQAWTLDLEVGAEHRHELRRTYTP